MDLVGTPSSRNSGKGWPWANEASPIANTFIKYGYLWVLMPQFMGILLGTKGSDQVDALPSVTTQKDDTSRTNFIEEIDKPQANMNSQFEDTVKRALAPWAGLEEHAGKILDDSYMNFRTDLVCLWAFSNLVPALILPRLLGDYKVEGTCLRFDKRLDLNVFWTECFALMRYLWL